MSLIVHKLLPNCPPCPDRVGREYEPESLGWLNVTCKTCLLKGSEIALVHKSKGRTLNNSKCGQIVYNQRCVRPWNGLVKITCPECNKWRPPETRAQLRAGSIQDGLDDSEMEKQIHRNTLIRQPNLVVEFNKGYSQGRLEGYEAGRADILDELSTWVEDKINDSKD